MDGHMSKPVELSQLRELVEYWVEQRARRQAGDEADDQERYQQI
jgi:hypothetical protein